MSVRDTSLAAVADRRTHPVTARVRAVHCKNCGAILYTPRDIEPPVLGFICSAQCERENTDHYSDERDEDSFY